MNRDQVALADIAEAARLISQFEVDWEEVWKTASEDVPNLMDKLQPLLREDPGKPR